MKVEKRFQNDFVALINTLTDKGYIVNVEGDDGTGYYATSHEYGIQSVTTSSALNTASQRFSVWMKDSGRILVNVGVRSARYNDFIYGGLTRDERATIKDTPSQRFKNTEWQYTFTDVDVFKKVMDNLKRADGTTDGIQDIETVAQDVETVTAESVTA